jgi:hypothetical protein
MELWGIELTYRGRKLTVLDLQSPARAKGPRSQPVQLSLWDSIKGLGDDALSVRVKRKSPQSITLQLAIGFKAASSR